MRNFTVDDSAWADFLISKAALILSSVVLFAALCHLVSDLKDFETQQKLDFLARDFKNAVDKVGAVNFQEISYCFNEQEAYRALPSGKDLKIRVSGEYVSLEAGSEGRKFSAVRPFAFRILPFNDSVLHEKLHTRFGARGSADSPLRDDYAEIKSFLSMLGTEEAVMNPEVNISLKKELIYVKEGEEVSTFACILIYQ
jgi:hypothetical protein